MEERVLYKEISEIAKECPSKQGKYLIDEFVREILPEYGFEIEDRIIAVKNPVMAVLMEKGKYFYGKYEDKEGVFLAFIGMGFQGNNLQVIWNPEVSLFA